MSQPSIVNAPTAMLYQRQTCSARLTYSASGVQQTNLISNRQVYRTTFNTPATPLPARQQPLLLLADDLLTNEPVRVAKSKLEHIVLPDSARAGWPNDCAPKLSLSADNKDKLISNLNRHLRILNVHQVTNGNLKKAMIEDNRNLVQQLIDLRSSNDQTESNEFEIEYSLKNSLIERAARNNQFLIEFGKLGGGNIFEDLIGENHTLIGRLYQLDLTGLKIENCADQGERISSSTGFL